MKDKELLYIPGPTEVPQSVLYSMAEHTTAHRSAEFSEIIESVEEKLKKVFQTKSNVQILTSSGTGAMCSALSNLINEKDKVLCLVNGKFSRRFFDIALSEKANAFMIEVPLGEAIEASLVEDFLNKNKDTKIVTMAHCETSTGVINPVRELASIIKKHGALSVVDGITTVGAVDCPMDEWGIDVLISSSQKSFMAPPGVAFLAASKEAYEVHKNCTHPNYYFDWTKYQENIEQNTTPFTPAINIIYGLNCALSLMKEEGLDNIFKRHKENSALLRKGLKDMGLKLFVEDDLIASPTVTTVLPPDKISVQDIISTMKHNYDIILAGGQNELKNKIFRIGTLGFVSKRDVITILSTLKETISILEVK